MIFRTDVMGGHLLTSPSSTCLMLQRYDTSAMASPSPHSATPSWLKIADTRRENGSVLLSRSGRPLVSYLTRYSGGESVHFPPERRADPQDMEVRVGLHKEARSALPICELESPLRRGWERCLDLKSGMIYFKNRETGRRTHARPGVAEYLQLGELRLSSDPARASCKELELFPLPSNLSVARDEDRSRDPSKSKCASPLSSSPSYSSSSSSSSASSVDFRGGDRGKAKRRRPTNDDVPSENAADDGSSRAMVLAGCPRCLMYVMFCKSNRKCPNCGHAFLVDQGIVSCKRRA